MKYLLDVNLLIAGIWTSHDQHSNAWQWMAGKQMVLCPLAELGFIRLSTNKKVLNAPMERTREMLEKFIKDRKADRIGDDLEALESRPRTSDQVTDHYLADLAAKHGLKLATMDLQLKHAAIELVS
jgi:predicted nucleic acid-binding protein